MSGLIILLAQELIGSVCHSLRLICMFEDLPDRCCKPNRIIFDANMFPIPETASFRANRGGDQRTPLECGMNGL